jgi:hypothetical protein
MSTETKHTPLPWKISATSAATIANMDGDHLLHCYGETDGCVCAGDAGRPLSVAEAWRKYDAMDTERKMLLNYGLVVVETGGAQ